MSTPQRFVCLACVVIGHALAAQAAAQFQVGGGFGGFANLPDGDFTWRWGEQRGGGFDDFSIRGGQDGFNCTLTGRLRPGSRMSRGDIRRIESELRASLTFIEAATRAMNTLDGRRELGWAVLDCTRPADN